MESEEQKPPDLFLNSEVKSEEIGSNSLLDDEYFRQNIPKLEEVDCTNYSMYSEQQSLGNSRNIDDFLEKEIKMGELEEIDNTDWFIDSEQKPEILEDYERFEYFEFPIEKIHSEGFVVPKLEKIDESSMYPGNQETKKEPLVWDSLKMPTLEPVLPSSTSRRDSTCQSECYTPRMTNERSKYSHRCVLCSSFQALPQVREVRLKIDRLVISVGRILSGEWNVKQGKEFHEHKQPRRKTICTRHFPEAINQIFNVLNIKKHDEIATCPVSRVNALMSTVNSISPWITSEEFLKILDEFPKRSVAPIEQSFERKQYVKTTYQLLNSSNEHTELCRVCSRRKTLSEMKYVETEEDIIVIIGQVLMKNYSIQKAKLFLTQSKYAYICHVHFHEAIDRISTFLNIEKPERNAICSKYKMKSLENMINDLSPNPKYSPIQEVIRSFVTRNQNILSGR